jgi:hypothetical protein
MAARRRTAAGIRCCRVGSMFAKGDVMARTCATVGTATHDRWFPRVSL